jgi:hypothetical protein
MLLQPHPHILTTGTITAKLCSNLWYRTQDFGGALCTGSAYTIPSGVHLELHSGKYRYIALFYQPTGSDPQEAYVIIDKTKYP